MSKSSSGGAKSYSTCQQKPFLSLSFSFLNLFLSVLLLLHAIKILLRRTNKSISQLQQISNNVPQIWAYGRRFSLLLFSLDFSEQKIITLPITHIFFFSCLSASNFISQLQQNNANDIGFCELWEIYQKNLKKFHFSLDLPIKIW